MKRYVKELANDILNANGLFVRRGTHRHPREAEIERIIRLCEKGMITSYEAVTLMIGEHEDSANNNESWLVADQEI